MRLEFTAEELQVFAIGYKAHKPFEVEDVFKGKPYSYVMERVNDIHKKYKELGLLDSQEFQDLMMTFLFPRKILSILSENICWISICYSAIGRCVRSYNKDKNTYELWTIENIVEINNVLSDFLKLKTITYNKRVKNLYEPKYFMKHFLKEPEKLDENEKMIKKIFDDCFNSEVKLGQEGNEFGYDITITTEFFITNEGIEYVKSYWAKKPYLIEIGITDSNGLIDIAFHQATPVPKKNKQKKIILILAVIISVILLFCGLIYISNNNIYLNKEYNVENIKDDFIIEHENKYSIITDKKTNEAYIIKINENNGFEELIKTQANPHILGIYNNRLYYSDDEELAYIELNNKSYNKINCISFKNARDEYLTGYPDFEISSVGQGFILNKNVYFTDGATPSSNLYKIDINETDLKNSVTVIDDAISFGKWNIDLKNEFVYYAKYNENYSIDIYKYNINTNKKEKIIEKLDSFEFNNSYILYVKENENNKLYLYNIKDKSNKLICETFRYSPTVSRALFYNDDIYYINQTRLIKYNSGSNNIVYSEDTEEMYGINAIDKNIIEIIYLSGKTKYLVDGKITNEQPSISVLMKNEQLKKFPLGITYEDEKINWEGTYEFYEFAEPDENRGYIVKIYKKDSNLYANIDIEGFMTLLKMQANITEEGNKINITQAVYKKGDILFSFEKEENVIKTYWNKLEPMLIKKKKNGKVYFTKE